MDDDSCATWRDEHGEYALSASLDNSGVLRFLSTPVRLKKFQMWCKLVILLTLIGLTSSDLWELFKKKYDKTYKPWEERHKRETFDRNAARIAEHNHRYDLGFEKSRMSLWEFSDMSPEEFMDRRPLPTALGRANISNINRSEVTARARPYDRSHPNPQKNKDRSRNLNSRSLKKSRSSGARRH